MIDVWSGSPALVIGVAGLFGLLIGSFLNVVIFRVPRMMERGNVAGVVEWFDDADHFVDARVTVDGPRRSSLKKELHAARPAFEHLLAAMPDETLVRPASRCGACGHRIRAIENVPVVSYLVLKGRCSACKSPISARYPAIELLTGVLFAAVAWRFGPSLAMLASMVLVAMLVALTFIDADAMLLPDSLTLPLLWIGLLFALEGGFVPLTDAVWGAIVGYLCLWPLFLAFKWLTGKEGFGHGDFKLLAALGAWFGWKAMLPILLLSAGVGSVVGIAMVIGGKMKRSTPLPFGVYIAPAGIVMLFTGDAVIRFILPTLY